VSVRRDTPLTYLAEVLLTSWKHGGELTATIGGVVAIGLAALLTRSLLHLPAFSGAYVMVLLSVLVAAALLFVAAVSTWRLHHRQQIALATTRTLLDLNARDRAERGRI